MWPNPSSENVFISIQGSNEIFTFEIRNAIGQVVRQQRFLHHDTINVQSLQSGVYLVAMKNAEGDIITNQKLLIR
jgi:hypothetical protein